MASEVSAEIQTIIGPVLADRGFTLDDIDDSPDEGGRPRHVVYYRSNDCKIQVYESAREGEVNCMIAPLDAPNEWGLDSRSWHFLTHFAQRRNPPSAESLRAMRAEYDSYSNRLEWLRDRITKYYDDAHRGILARRDEGYSL
ncbi:hypothetical protein ACQ856_28835 (plasmid) [Mycolicibacterium psychrotolerans]|jgi:hypothetical protein|uniref:hypothetical protein n=1 Tax=Mycolicibacterium psychrotolerans TaxID=216929 RepID=UPI003D67EF10